MKLSDIIPAVKVFRVEPPKKDYSGLCSICIQSSCLGCKFKEAMINLDKEYEELRLST